MYFPLYCPDVDDGKYIKTKNYDEDSNNIVECFGIQLFTETKKTTWEGGEILKISYNPVSLSVWSFMDESIWLINNVIGAIFSDVIDLVYLQHEQNELTREQEQYWLEEEEEQKRLELEEANELGNLSAMQELENGSFEQHWNNNRDIIDLISPSSVVS